MGIKKMWKNGCKAQLSSAQGTTLFALALSIVDKNDFSVSHQPRKPCSRLLFMLHTSSMVLFSTTSANHQCPTS
jgi:hypothetical protein